MAIPALWKTNPIDYFIEGEGEFAVASLTVYKRFSGFYFDRIADLSSDSPFRFTWSDIVAVNGLSVNIDARTAWNLSKRTASYFNTPTPCFAKLTPSLNSPELPGSTLIPRTSYGDCLRDNQVLGALALC